VASNPETVILEANFETGQATGWTLSGNAAIDNSTAIGQYSLRNSDKGASSTRGVSTAGYTGVSIRMSVAGESLEGGESCVAEYSTNGGSSWLPVVTLNAGAATGVFIEDTVAPAAASNNANLRLRTRIDSNNKDDHCWFDAIRVVGTASGAGSQVQSLDAEPQGLVATVVDNVGFDPGFDHLFGDGNVGRELLGYELLMDGGALDGPVERTAYAVPGSAALPEHAFEGWLELRDTAGQALPDLDVQLVQIGNHLFPLVRDTSVGSVSAWEYVIETGRVWRESADHGFSRANLPFRLVQKGTDCAQDGVLTFLFSDDAVTSHAVYQVSGGPCGSAAADSWGVLEVVYSPAPAGMPALGIEAVLACAADNWLPLVQGRGGFSLVLLPDNTVHYELRDGDTVMLLDAAQQSAAMGSLCE